MAVEVATKIADLNKLWPLGTDPKSEGDDHIRLIKNALQSTDGGALTKVAVTVLTSSGTYTKPAGLKFLEVWSIGGGGAGSNSSGAGAGQASGSGAGGGGGTSYRLYAAAAVAATTGYTIGAGGATPGGAGGAGGATSFAGQTGGGGTGGGTISPATASLGLQSSGRGAGGSASGGILNIAGGDSQFGWCNPHGRVGVALGGIPGGSMFTQSLVGTISGGAPANGVTGLFPGGGGTGSATGASGAAGSGSAGGAGAIVMKEYF